MGRRLFVRTGLLTFAAVDAIVGTWAAFAPRSFFDTFPGFGRAWVSALPPFNEHLVRDVGGLNLVLAALFVVAALRPDRTLVRAVCLGSLLWAIPHLVFHLSHLSGLEPVDAVAQAIVIALAIIGPLAIAALA